MSVFIKSYNPQKSFSYQVGKVITEKPWTRPNYYKLKEFFKEIQNSSEILKDYNLYLMGGVLWDFNNTWDVDIIIVGNLSSYIILEDYMHYMYDIALNKHNLLVDISWVEHKPEDIIYTPDYPFTINNNFLKIGYIKKQIGDEFEEINLCDKSNYILCGDYLIKGDYKNKDMKKSLIDKIKNNPNSITKITFPVKDFLEKDEDYFLRNTNRL